MTDHPHLSVVPPGAEQDDAVTVVLFLNPALYADRKPFQNAVTIADTLVKLGNGDLNSALGSVLSALLDLTATGQAGPASEALGAAVELGKRITLARAELRAEL